MTAHFGAMHGDRLDKRHARAQVLAFPGIWSIADRLKKQSDEWLEEDPDAGLVSQTAMTLAARAGRRMVGVRDILCFDHPVVIALREKLVIEHAQIPAPDKAIVAALSKLNGFKFDGLVVTIDGVPLPAGKAQTDWFIVQRYRPLYSSRVLPHLIYRRDPENIIDADRRALGVPDGVAPALNRRKKGDLSCGGNNVPMDKVDEAVVSALETRLFQPERLTALLGDMLDASSAADAGRRKQVAVLRTEETEVTNSIRALFMMVESGATAPDDPFLKERLATLKLRLTSVAEEIVALERQIGAKSSRITPEKVERFAAAMRAKLRDGGEPQVRRRYVRAFVGEVVMSREQIIIRGPNRALELAAAGEMPADDKVRTFMGEWRARQDSNLRPPA